jgi:hypothetical protein
MKSHKICSVTFAFQDPPLCSSLVLYLSSVTVAASPLFSHLLWDRYECRQRRPIAKKIHNTEYNANFWHVTISYKRIWRYFTPVLLPSSVAALVPFKGPKKSRFLGPPPLKCPELWIVPPQNHFVPPHINNRYINS